jgi:hypothetical protein
MPAVGVKSGSCSLMTARTIARSSLARCVLLVHAASVYLPLFPFLFVPFSIRFSSLSPLPLYLSLSPSLARLPLPPRPRCQRRRKRPGGAPPLGVVSRVSLRPIVLYSKLLIKLYYKGYTRNYQWRKDCYKCGRRRPKGILP